MQTPRGFLIGAGLIAVIAAFASVGHPRSETDVQMESPPTSPMSQPPINASSTGPDIEVLAKRVEARDAVPSTTMELAGASGDTPQSPTPSVASAPAVEPSTSATPAEERTRPSVDDRERPATEPTTQTPAAASPTTVAAAATTPPSSTTSTTLLPMPTIPDLTVNPITLPPPITVPPITVPTVPLVTPQPIELPTPVVPQLSIPVVKPIPIDVVDISPRKTMSAIAYDPPAA